MSDQQQKPTQQSSPSDKPKPKLVPARAEDHPFCAYKGENGETCAETEHLTEVLSMQGSPRMVLVACPLHYEAVRQVALDFVRRCKTAPQMMVLTYDGDLT
ncbi:MAG: hypothetical protein ACRDHZ_00565 [Ktedonobacteraceae bacterium]